MSVFFKSRKAIACVPAICLLAVAVYSAMHTHLKITPKYDDSTVEIALIDPEQFLPPPPEPEPEPVVEEPPPPPEVEVAEAQIEAPPPPPKPKPPAPKPPPPKPKPAVVKAAPTPAKPQPVAQAPAPAAAPIAAAPVTRAVAQPVPNNAVDLESRYTARLLAELEKYKQYPRGREASLQRPQGSVVVWLLVDRSGKVLDSGIEKKANNMLLNRAAHTSLQRLDSVVPFPENTFSGKDKYRFSATLVYNIEQ